MRFIIASVLSVFVLTMFGFAQSNVPQKMSYQGYLTDNTGTPVADGTYSLIFSMYTVDVAGIPVWTETHPAVIVNKGLFNVILGQGNPSVLLSIPFDVQYWLGIKIGADPEMAPRVKMASVAYSLRARTADMLSNPASLTLAGDVSGALSANTITSNAVTTTKIADNAIVASKIANGAVTHDKLASDIISSLNGVHNDGGNIDLIAGANVTLTPNDAANTITIAATGGGGGLTLPYSESATTASMLFTIQQLGTGQAGYFWNNNAANASDALRVANLGTSTAADAISVKATGGNAIEAYNDHATTPTIYAYNSGGGPVATFGTGGASANPIVNITKSGGAGHGINLTYGGTGSAIYVDNNSSGVGMELKQDGTGNAAYFHIDNATSANNTLRATSASTNVNSDALEVVAVAGNGLDATNNSATNPTILANNSNADATSPVIKGGSYFIVNKSGITTSRQYVATSNCGSGTPAAGGMYKDNVVCAWARVTAAGGMVSSFGISSVTKTSTGTYRINFSNAFASGNDVCATASARQSATNRFVMIGLYDATYVTVEIYNNTGVLIDNDFSVIVTGRQN